MIGDRTATEEEIAELRKMTTARIRRNYWLCQSQITMIHQKRNPRDYDDAYADLYAWQMTYLDEMVRRGQQV